MQGRDPRHDLGQESLRPGLPEVGCLASTGTGKHEGERASRKKAPSPSFTNSEQISYLDQGEVSTAEGCTFQEKTPSW